MILKGNFRNLVFTLFLYISIFFGFIVFRYPSDDFQYSRIGIVFLTLNIFHGFFQIKEYFGMFYDFNQGSHEITLYMSIMIIHVCFLILYCTRILNLILNFAFNKKIFEIIKRLRSFEAKVRCFNLPKLRNLL